jgi:AcrR family transcriptional regulator
VVDALLKLYDEGEIRPGTTEIARRAGVSERSVFRHFEDLDALVEVAIARQFARVGHLFTPPPARGSRAARIDALVSQRLAIHDAASGAMRAGALIAPDSSRLQATFGARRRLLRGQIAVLFDRELRRRADGDRSELELAIGAISSLEHIEHLRTDLRITRDRTHSILARSITALLVSRKAE